MAGRKQGTLFGLTSELCPYCGLPRKPFAYHEGSRDCQIARRLVWQERWIGTLAAALGFALGWIVLLA